MRKYIFSFLLSFSAATSFSQNIAINTTGNLANATSILDIDAADKGLLIPRVALTQTSSNSPIGASVATSLLVYNTATINDVSPGYYYWNGSLWQRAIGGATGPTGTFGPNGASGPTGASGSNAATGPTGPAGPMGSGGLSGLSMGSDWTLISVINSTLGGVLLDIPAAPPFLMTANKEYLIIWYANTVEFTLTTSDQVMVLESFYVRSSSATGQVFPSTDAVNAVYCGVTGWYHLYGRSFNGPITNSVSSGNVSCSANATPTVPSFTIYGDGEIRISEGNAGAGYNSWDFGVYIFER